MARKIRSRAKHSILVSRPACKALAGASARSTITEARRLWTCPASKAANQSEALRTHFQVVNGLAPNCLLNIARDVGRS